MPRRPVGLLIADMLERIERIRRNPVVPWRRIVGLRHRIVHEYFDVDLDLVWEIVHSELPALGGQLRGLGFAQDDEGSTDA